MTPSFTERPGSSSGPDFAPEYRYAGFWIRACALAIDVALVTFLQAAIGSLVARTNGSPVTGTLKLMLEAAGVVADAAYFSLFWTTVGATPGKMLFGLKVIDETGGPVRPGQSVKRWFGQILSGALFGAGFFRAGWTPRKRSLHDAIAHTFVIHSR